MIGTRRRKAALTGAVPPHELLARLAQVEEPEPGSASPPATEAQGRAAEEGPQHGRLAADLSSADSKTSQHGGDAAGDPAPASLAAEIGAGGNSLSRNAAAMAGAAATVAAHHAALQAPVQPDSAAGVKVSGAEQVASAPAEPLPAYTSLARQQLQQRLKAAIAAGTRPAATGVAGAHAAQPSAQASRAGRKAGSQHAQQTQAARLLHSPRLSPGPAGSGPSATQSGQQQVFAGLEVADTLPVPSAASLEDGFQLLLPGSTSSGGTAGLEQQAQPACPAQAGAEAKQQHLPTPEAGSAQPHWLGGHLLRQRLYLAAPQQPGRRQHTQQGVQRGLLALRMPPLTDQFAKLMPVRAGDAAGTPCLLVLPSEGPSSRHEAESALAALHQLLADPAAAAPRAATWRQQLLLCSSAAALLGLTAEYAPVQHEQQLRRAQPGHAGAGSGLLAGPAWLAGSSDTGAGLARAPPGRLDEALQGVRSSSGFLRPSSHGSASGSPSPLPPLAPPPASSRLCCAPPGAGRAGGQGRSRAQAAEHSSMVLHSTGSVLCLDSSPLTKAASAAMSAPDAAAPTPPPVLPPPPINDPAWDGYCCASLAAGLAACMAEAVRQVEVGCAERGRLLAQLWNSYTGVLAAAIQQQQAQVQALAVANANLAAEASQLRWEVSSMGFLRTEIGRLRIDKETVALELEDCRRGMAALGKVCEEAGQERRAVEAHLARRLATLRWRHAGAAVLASSWRSNEQLRRPHSGSRDAAAEPTSTLLRQAAELERLAGAAVEAQHQQRERRQGKRAEAALAAALSAPVMPAAGAVTPRTRHTSRLQHGSSAEPDRPPHQRQVFQPGAASGSGAASNWTSWTAGGGRSVDGGFVVGGALGALRCLQPEARAVLLLSQPAEQRRQLLAAMTDAERAGLAVLLEEPARLQLYDELGSALALSTDAFIDRNPLLLAKLLATLPPEQAAARLGSKLAQQQQVAVLQAVPPQQAAELLAAKPEAARQELVLGMLPGAAAGLLHWLMPAAALQLLVGGCCGQADAATPGRSPADAHTAAGGPEAGSRSSWAAEVLQRLDDRHLAAMLAAAQPVDIATLLEQASGSPRQRLLDLLPQRAMAAALAAAHQRQAAAARRHTAAAAGPAAAVEVQFGEMLATPQSPPPAALDATPRLDPGCALLAHFQQLSAAEKTSLLLMGGAEAAALLLPLLGEEEAEGVLLLLPKQRQEQLLQLQHPAEERRMRGVALQASRRKSSLLLPQQLAAAAAGPGPHAEAERRGSNLSPRQLAAVVTEAAPQEEPRRSSLAPQQLAAAAAAGAAASTRGRKSFLASQQLAAAPAPAARGRRRSSLLSAQQLAAASAAVDTQVGSAARRTSSFVAAAQGAGRRGSLSAASPRAAAAAVAAALMAEGAARGKPG